MDTMFKYGDIVYSDVNAQGLKKDEAYQIVYVRSEELPFGTLVTYIVQQGTQRFGVSNGHLVLRHAAQDDVPEEE